MICAGEFAMADEAFALSPISARASMPSEQDYDAIREAFMETSRGRWFLGEYAKRNRNADTSMVLDAVARIEQTIAAQRQPVVDTDSGLADALTAIRGALDEARAAAAAALDSLAIEEHLAPVRKGARVIKEIAWRWREIGADGRICDLMDSQVSAIEAACGQIASAAPKDALSAAFDLIEQRIARFDDGDSAAAPAAEEAASSPAPSTAAPSLETPAAAAGTIEAATDSAEAAIGSPAMPGEEIVAPVEAVDMAAGLAEAAEAAEVAAEVVEITADASDAHDEALLDLVAFEMSAPDPSDNDDAAEADADAIHVAEMPPAEPVMVVPEPEPMAASPEPEPMAAPALPLAIQPSLQPSLELSPQPSRQPSPEASHEPSHEPSLGSSLIASGIVRRPHSAASDPLAPIRRMSQAEKIALFS
jgi:hypothetical protein